MASEARRLEALVATLVVKEAEKWFRREDGAPFKILDRLSFQAREGCVTVVVGPSGCGKSTLLNAIVGLERLDRGDLLFLNGAYNNQRPLIGYVFQSPRLLPWKTVGDNIRLALQGAGVPQVQWDERLHRYLELVGLDEYANQYPLYLSGGQRQRVGLARALAVESDLVLMDEPFASVDELTARQLRQTTRRLCEELHRTVLFVTHNLPEAAYMSDFVVTLTRRPATLQEYVPNPLPSPRRWGPDVYGFAAELENKVTLKEEGEL
jgi:ABC-type nitrate/sulfonate/bicarbonate transport system ATPase subunit